MDKLIELDARRQRLIAEYTRTIETKDGDWMGVVGLAQIDDAYAPYLKALYTEIDAAKASQWISVGNCECVCDSLRNQKNSGNENAS